MGLEFPEHLVGTARYRRWEAAGYVASRLRSDAETLREAGLMVEAMELEGMRSHLREIELRIPPDVDSGPWGRAS